MQQSEKWKNFTYKNLKKYLQCSHHMPINQSDANIKSASLMSLHVITFYSFIQFADYLSHAIKIRLSVRSKRILIILRLEFSRHIKMSNFYIDYLHVKLYALNTRWTVYFTTIVRNEMYIKSRNAIHHCSTFSIAYNGRVVQRLHGTHRYFSRSSTYFKQRALLMLISLTTSFKIS